MFDLPGLIVAKLREAGLASVSPSPADTFADEERFFQLPAAIRCAAFSPTPSLISAIILG